VAVPAGCAAALDGAKVGSFDSLTRNQK
jgi:hypothetical protein